MDRHIKSRTNGKYQEIVSTGTLRFLDFARLQMVKGDSHTGETGAREYVLDIFGGSASITIERAGKGNETFPLVGDRADVFSGNWSSYPPHKHDRAHPPQEAVLEEIYFFRVKPSQGFGFIWTYTDPDDPEGFSTVFVVEDGDTVLLPKGYHPVVAAPGYQLHYTWVLAGEERRYGAWADDPRHAWVKGQ
jgi:5-deoxy-glucuronate isomerase